MKYIEVYDIEAEKLEKLAEEHGATVAEIVEALLDQTEDIEL